MDFWGDAGQICAAVGGAAGGIATVFVAAFGKKLWQATDALTEQTRLLAVQTAQANDIEERAGAAVLHDRLRPRLAVRILSPQGGQGSLIIRHTHESESETIDSLRAEIFTDNDTGEPDTGPIKGPWRFKDDAQGVDEHGRTAAPRGPLPRGVATSWTLTQQPAEPFGRGYQWGSDQDRRPRLVGITVVIDNEEWRYSALVNYARAVSL